MAASGIRLPRDISLAALLRPVLIAIKVEYSVSHKLLC